MVTRRAALRPLTMIPVLVLPTCVSLPNRDVTVSASPSSLRSMQSEDRRVRVSGPSEGRVS